MREEKEVATYMSLLRPTLVCQTNSLSRQPHTQAGTLPVRERVPQ